MTTNALFWVVVAVLVVGIIAGSVVGRILARQAEGCRMVDDAHEPDGGAP